MWCVSEVAIEVNGGIAVITIDRPDSRNAIAQGTMSELHIGLDTLENSEEIAVVVLRGAGDRAFVSGGDLKDLAAIRDLPSAVEMATNMRRFLDRLSTFPAPVIAAINGSAIGGGAEVAVAADIRIAAEDIKIGFTQSKLAIMPAWGGAERLAEIVGRSKAMLLVSAGETITAAKAMDYGLIDITCPRVEFEQSWRTLAEKFAQLPSGVSRSIKQMISAAKPHHHPDLESSAVHAFARAWVNEAHWDAVAAARAASAALRSRAATP
jgi:enoyl-CoA hydratase